MTQFEKETKDEFLPEDSYNLEDREELTEERILEMLEARQYKELKE